MPSRALADWQGDAANQLGELEAAHTAGANAVLDGEIDKAYILLLAAKFQRFCRDLHTEAALFLSANAVKAPAYGTFFNSALTRKRQLDGQNAKNESIKDDFARLGSLDLWSALNALDSTADDKLRRLTQLNTWRNGIAHANALSKANLQTVSGTTAAVGDGMTVFRPACNDLANLMDQAVADHLNTQLGATPW